MSEKHSKQIRKEVKSMYVTAIYNTQEAMQRKCTTMNFSKRFKAAVNILFNKSIKDFYIYKIK